MELPVGYEAQVRPEVDWHLKRNNGIKHQEPLMQTIEGSGRYIS